MGEMIYENNQRSPEQLAAGTFLGYSYYVLSFGHILVHMLDFQEIINISDKTVMISLSNVMEV